MVERLVRVVLSEGNSGDVRFLSWLNFPSLFPDLASLTAAQASEGATVRRVVEQVEHLGGADAKFTASKNLGFLVLKELNSK